MKTPTQFMKKSILSVSFLLAFVGLFANSTFTVKDSLLWEEGSLLDNPLSSTPTKYYSFKNASYLTEHLSLPYYSSKVKLPGKGSIGVEFINTEYAPIDLSDSPHTAILSDQLIVKTSVDQARQDFSGIFSFIPIRKNGNTFEKLISFEIKVTFRPAPLTTLSRTDFTYTSKLNDGDIYKIAVSNEGLHKIDYNFLKESLKIDIDNVDPKTIKVLGNFGGPLPLKVDDFRYDDLEENAIFVRGEGDGKFDSGDYILFYANGPHRWEYNNAQDKFDRTTNVFNDKKYYFIKISPEEGKRIAVQASINDASYESNSFDDFTRFEEDQINLLYSLTGAQGSGRNWYGDFFNQIREKTYTFTFPNLITSEPVKISSVFIARHNQSTKFSLTANNSQKLESNAMPGVLLDKVDRDFATSGSINSSFTSNGDGISIQLEYPGVGDQTNKGWLDYIQLTARRKLVMTDSPMTFRDSKTLTHASSTFKISNASDNIEIWDISNSQNPKKQEAALNGSTLSFGATTTTLREFIAFRFSNSFPSPEAIGKIGNQNLHAYDDIDMVIIYHPDFVTQAEQLAAHRQNLSGLRIATVPTNLLWNEFSSGGMDPTAIRDFARMLYVRNPDFKYLLLFGDASFDYKNIYSGGGNYVPTFETLPSLNALSAYPTDDYFSYLDEGEGQTLTVSGRDIAVGRIPARNAPEAQGVVNKIIHYDTAPEVLGDWRNRTVYVADDEDGNAHFRQADEIARDNFDVEPDYNQTKIYLDAFAQEATPGGARIPQAQETLNRDMFRGALAVNYLGHGGSSGWAQERVLRLGDIQSWQNYDRLPLFITATCSFAGFDEPGLTTAGELALLREDGGAIGLFTTVRAVFSNQNKVLTSKVFKFLFSTDAENEPWPIGEILRVGKNDSSSAGADNTNKFTLLGDPSMKLAIPTMNVATTSINGNPIGTVSDTIRALQKVTIEGIVTDHNGQIIPTFNGRVFPTVFDKRVTVTTLGQDERSLPEDFTIQKSTLFKGKASVTNGKFKFSFIVPKDIDYDFGDGRISYYAENGVSLDANGHYEAFVVGGSDPNGVQDDQGPIVEVFMNDDEFVSGGLTDENPAIYIKLSDDFGINVAGNSVGHDLTAILDGNTQSPFILNDFYEAEQDDYTKGTVRFPLFDISEGKHRIEVTAWDIANNFSTGSTEFFVASSDEVALEHVLNYPNPFTTNTSFQFEHNLNGVDLEVQIQIFSVSGKLVKTIVHRAIPEGNMVRNIQWDGTDDYGDRLGKGVYVYRVKLRAPEITNANLKAESEFERLVILK